MNKLCTHIVKHESFLLYFISKIVARLEKAEAPCFMKNASASGSSKSQMLPSSLPASFFKMLPLPQKFNRFHIPVVNTAESQQLYVNKCEAKCTLLIMRHLLLLCSLL